MIFLYSDCHDAFRNGQRSKKLDTRMSYFWENFSRWSTGGIQSAITFSTGNCEIPIKNPAEAGCTNQDNFYETQLTELYTLCACVN